MAAVRCERERYTVHTTADSNRDVSYVVQRLVQGGDLLLYVLSHDFLDKYSSRARSSVSRRRAWR